jgi:hypothetical protein
VLAVAGYEVAALAGIGLNLHGIGFDRNRLLRRAQLHLEIDADAGADRQYDVFLFCDLEALGIGFDDVFANLKIDSDVLAGVIRRDSMSRAGINVGHGDGHIRDRGTGRIGNRPNDGGLLRERGN